MAKNKLNIDQLLITPLIQDIVSGVFPNDDKEFQHIVKWFESDAFSAQREKKSKTYIACYEGKIVAFIAISMHSVKTLFGSTGNTPFNFPVMLVGKLYTHPDYRGNGIGKELLNVAVSIALKVDEMIGCAGLLVDANNNPDTVRFYEKYGFEEIEGKRSGTTIPMFFKIHEEPVVPDDV